MTDEEKWKEEARQICMEFDPLCEAEGIFVEGYLAACRKHADRAEKAEAERDDWKLVYENERNELVRRMQEGDPIVKQLQARVNELSARILKMENDNIKLNATLSTYRSLLPDYLKQIGELKFLAKAKERTVELEEGIKKHKEAVWGIGKVGHPYDEELYKLIGE